MLKVPVLVHRLEVGEDDSRSFKTTVIMRGDFNRSEGSKQEAQEEEVLYELRKREGAAFPDRISVGRTRTVDVTLSYPEISKYHAYFTCQGDRYFLTDAKATNGTFVDDVRLEPQVATPLKAMANLRFGTHAFRFFLPGALYDYLRG